MTVEELADQTILGGEPSSGTGILLTQRLAEKAALLPTPIGLGSTAAVKEAVHAGGGISLVLRGTAAAELQAGRLHALQLQDVELTKTLWIAHRAALVPEDPIIRFRTALTNWAR